MCELTNRARRLEVNLRDLGADVIEVSLASARMIFEEDLTDELARHALMGCLATSEAALEQLEKSQLPVAIDGDVHFRCASWAPGRQLANLLEQLRNCEQQARDQRDAILRPLALAAMAQAHSEERASRLSDA